MVINLLVIKNEVLDNLKNYGHDKKKLKKYINIYI
jgi:hypothetical protein